MNSIWNKNLDAFKQRFPSLAQIHASTIQSISQMQFQEDNSNFSFWKIISAKNGSFSAVENNLTLHSSYNPQREAEQSIGKIYDKTSKNYIFTGFGLGYHVCAISKLITSETLILIEPEPAHFFAALTLLDWTEVFSVKQLIVALACPPENIIQLIGTDGLSDSVIFSLPAFTQHSQNYFNTIKTLFDRNKTKNDINAATYNRFAHLWCRNTKKNIVHLNNHKTLQLFLKNWNKPSEDFLLVAAGPSLEKILPVMNELKDRMIIVCVETALQALLRINVQPDFIIITDPQYWAYKHIAALKAPESRLICPISVYPAVFRFQCKEILICSDFFPISRFFEQQLGSFGDLGSGGSVASSAWSFAQINQAKRIFFAGLDLSFPTKQTHIKGSSGEQTFHSLSKRTLSVEQLSVNTIYNANPDFSTDYEGKKILTDSRMKMFAWWFESRIAAHPEIKNYSFCKESMKIPGVEYFDPKSYIKETDCILKSENQQNNNLQWEKQVELAKQEYEKNIKHLVRLVNYGIEKCMIFESDTEKLELLQKELDQEFSKNPLQEIIRMINSANKKNSQIENHIHNGKDVHDQKNLQTQKNEKLFNNLMLLKKELQYYL